MNLNLFGRQTRARQEMILKQICEDSRYIPQFEQRFRTMALFTVNKDLKRRTDIFSYVPADGQSIAVGYRIQHTNGRYLAEPWTFIVEDPIKSVGIEITERIPNSLYFGSVVPQPLIDEYGTNAYSLMLGNLNLLKRYTFKPVSL